MPIDDDPGRTDRVTTGVRGVRRGASFRHVVVGSLSVVAVAVLMVVTELSVETWGSHDQRKSNGVLWQYNVSTGTVALALLVVTLSIRPIRVLRGHRRSAVHLPWRRVTGLWTVVLVAVHVPGGLAIHSTGWRVWTPFESVVPWADARPLDEFTLGYWAGLVAVLLLAPLALTSRDASIRRLGQRRWRRLHRVLTWATYWVVAVHVVALQYGEFRDRRHVALTASVFATALTVRLAAMIVGRRHRRPDAAPVRSKGSDPVRRARPVPR